MDRALLLASENDRGTASAADSRVRSLVIAAWRECFPQTPFSTDVSWRDLGVDSLSALGFIVRLERSLGRPIGAAALSTASTTADLLAMLERGQPARRDPAGSDDGRMGVFYIPGLLGDDPTQARFRHALRREVRFDYLDPPPPGARARFMSDISARASGLADQVQQRQPEGDIRLVGCSFAALLAQETARILEVRGRRVSSLILLDGFLTPRARPGQGWKTALGGLLGPVLVASGAADAFAWLIGHGPAKGGLWSRRQEIRLLRGFGLWAARSWRPGRCAAPALLFASEDFAGQSSTEGWRRICPSLEVMDVPGNHFGLFDPPALAIILPAILDHLHRALAA